MDALKTSCAIPVNRNSMSARPGSPRGSDMFKGLSMWEPWATAVAFNLKGFETRSWQTSYRGPLLICASPKRLPIAQIIMLLVSARLALSDLQYGRAVCIVELVDIFKTEDIVVSHIEKKFGDLSPGRFAWKFENVRRFANPPWVRGKQGLFDVPDDLIKSLDTHEPI